MTKEQLAHIQRELAEKQAEADCQRAARGKLPGEHAAAQKQINTLTMGLVLAEEQKKTLQSQAETLKSQVDAERTERAKVPETATQLAAGVGAARGKIRRAHQGDP